MTKIFSVIITADTWKCHSQTNLPDDYQIKLILPIYYLARYQDILEDH